MPSTATSHPCPACGSPLPSPQPTSCPNCGVSLSAGGNPETVTIEIGRNDSVVYLPDETQGDAGTGDNTRSSLVPTSVVGPRASLSHVGMEGGVTLERPLVPERTPSGGTTTIPTSRIEAQASVGEVLSQRPGEEKYVVASEIARGGMGVILRAVDRDIRRDVAMKVLLSERKDRSRERFVEEAQIAGQLEHPNIVPVHDLGVDADGRLFFTMKLVQGKSLGELLDQRRRPEIAAQMAADPQAAPEHSLARSLQVYLAVLNAIAFSHDRGVIHRDLKPDNVMVGDFGEVLVMDWGLAKVTRRTGSAKAWTHQHVRATNLGQLAAGRGKGRTPLVLPEPGRSLATDERLKTLVEGFASQSEEIDGKAIEGTPAYMAPEQARGELSEVDERSDIYSLGAILYELLTLSPPVRGRSVRAILDDVVAGRILEPESRAPERTIPPELSAIAMKALARDKETRYQTVLELRRDIELYLDDRQVSAKEDTTWEALVKLVRRNQEVVTAIVVCLVIVVGVTIFLFNAIIKQRHRYQQSAREAQTRLDQLRTEQEKRAQDQRRAAPALVAKARRAIDLKDFSDARGDVDLAIQYDPALADARVLAAQLAIRDQDWAAAAIALGAVIQSRPEDADSIQLLALVRQAAKPQAGESPDGKSSVHLTQIADVLVRQGAYTVAESLYQSGQDLVLMYRVRLEKQWPGCTRTGFTADKNGRLSLEGLAGRPDVIDISPLEGLPLVRLSLAGTKILDLGALKRMPLASLDVSDTAVRSLEALSGLPLVQLRASNTRVDDLSPLAQAALEELDVSRTWVADLTPIERMPLTMLDISRTRVADLAVLTSMPLTTLRIAGCRITDLQPLATLHLVELDAAGALIADLAPLRTMRLTALRITGTRVTDLAPLAGMPLTTLDLTGLPIGDLSPLVGMPLTSLDLRRCPLTSLNTLSKAKLSNLGLAETKITDLRPLQGMPLTTLDLSGTPVTDLSPLAGLPLASLALDGTPVADLSPLRLLPLKELRLTGTRVTDLRPLCDDKGAAKSLVRLILPPAPEKGLDQLRQLPNLLQVGKTWDGTWAKVPQARDFWRANQAKSTPP